MLLNLISVRTGVDPISCFLESSQITMKGPSHRESQNEGGVTGSI